jgi:hypothetical protein
MSKGSKRRPFDRSKWNDNWDNIFRKDKIKGSYTGKDGNRKEIEVNRLEHPTKGTILWEDKDVQC